MNWTLSWSVVAERDLLSMSSWRVAAKVDAAIMQFSATGRGAERVSPTDPRQIRIRVIGAEARLYLDPETRTVYIVRVFRRD